MLIDAVSGAVGGGITSFAMSGVQQSKINEVAKLSTLVGELSTTDQNQWNNQNNINL